MCHYDNAKIETFIQLAKKFIEYFTQKVTFC